MAYVSRILSELRNESWANSGLLIGSCAKKTIVPGWSDIDILVFAEYDAEPEWILRSREIVDCISDRPNIGITIDIINVNRLTKERRIGGQPLGMLYEVASYGELIFGANPFDGINIDKPEVPLIKADARNYILSDIFSWNRRYLSDQLSGRAFSDYTCKTYLRSLIRFSAPITQGPFSYERRLNDLEESSVGSVLKGAMRQAVEYRASYELMMHDESARTLKSQAMIDAIPSLYDLL